MARKSETVDNYIGSRSAEVGPLLEELGGFVHAKLPSATEDMQYSVPVLLDAHGVPVVYLFGSKNHVNFEFLRNAELTNPNGILKGSGTPSKHNRVMPRRPIDKATLTEFVRQCEGIDS